MSAENGIRLDFIRDGMPIDDRFTRLTPRRSALGSVVEKVFPTVASSADIVSPGDRWKEIQTNIRSTVFGKDYEIVTSDDVKILQQTQQEISAWLSGQATPKTITPYIPDDIKQTLEDTGVQQVSQIYGSFVLPTYDESAPHHYYVRSANEWPTHIVEQVGDLAKYYELFFLLHHAHTYSLWYTVHPDNTYDLKIKFYGEPDGTIHDYQPPTQPLEEMPKAEFELLKGELRSFNNIKDTLVKSRV